MPWTTGTEPRCRRPYSRPDRSPRPRALVVVLGQAHPRLRSPFRGGYPPRSTSWAQPRSPAAGLLVQLQSSVSGRPVLLVLFRPDSARSVPTGPGRAVPAGFRSSGSDRPIPLLRFRSSGSGRAAVTPTRDRSGSPFPAVWSSGSGRPVPAGSGSGDGHPDLRAEALPTADRSDRRCAALASAVSVVTSHAIRCADLASAVNVITRRALRAIRRRCRRPPSRGAAARSWRS